MTSTFLQEVLQKILKQHQSLDTIVFVLPSKRAGIFLKNHIIQEAVKPLFSPLVYSIEELIQEIADLEKSNNLDLLLELYEAFLPYLSQEEQRFESFLSWGTTLLADFNEIDRHLVDYKSLFAYLTATQRLKSWGDDQRPTPLISSTLKFWGHFEKVYLKFQSRLLDKGQGHQGLLYKKAAELVNAFIEKSKGKTFYFIGFNALNRAEELIIEAFISAKMGRVFWDIDQYFLMDNMHEAGFFIRNYSKKWPFTNTPPTQGPSRSFLEDKKITVAGVPKFVSQAKYAGGVLRSILAKSKEENVALVLADESLLSPMLNSLPSNIEKVNITMGLPLNKTNLYDFFNALFELHLNSSEEGWYYKEVDTLLSNPYTIRLLNTSQYNLTAHLKGLIKQKNLLFIKYGRIKELIGSDSNLISLLFPIKKMVPSEFFSNCQHIIQELRTSYNDSDNQQEQHALYGFFQLFNQMEGYMTTKPYLKSLRALKTVFDDLVSTEQIDFMGEPLGGVQIMGMLESRNLDFETVVITSVNEGILPTGKNQNSFIPFDIKKEFGLPTFKEKDAIYAYHFYRLLQRAKNIFLIYNTEPDVLMGNEKSRFITQLITDPNINNNVTHFVAAPEITIEPQFQKEIEKTPALIELLQAITAQGLSPSSLSNYVRNPNDFYLKHVLKLKDVEELEEHIAPNTFGTIVHDCLEDLYSPLIGVTLNTDNLTLLKNQIEPVVVKNFNRFYGKDAIKDGQNLIAFHVIQKYIGAFIDLDIQRANENTIVLQALEKPFNTQVPLSHDYGFFVLKGKLDRLETVNGLPHILDYKTGNAAQSEVELMHLEESITNEKRGKAFQLLCYALMAQKTMGYQDISASVVPIKKLSLGLLRFATKSSPRGPRNYSIDSDLLAEFEQQLNSLVCQILDSKIPFVDNSSTSL